MNLAAAVLVIAAGPDLLTARLPYQPGQYASGEIPRLPAGPAVRSRSHHGRIGTTLFPATAGKYNCPLLRADLPWMYDDMAAAEAAGYLNPVSQLEAALIGGVVAV